MAEQGFQEEESFKWLFEEAKKTRRGSSFFPMVPKVFTLIKNDENNFIMLLLLVMILSWNFWVGESWEELLVSLTTKFFFNIIVIFERYENQGNALLTSLVTEAFKKCLPLTNYLCIDKEEQAKLEEIYQEIGIEKEDQQIPTILTHEVLGHLVKLFKTQLGMIKKDVTRNCGMFILVIYYLNSVLQKSDDAFIWNWHIVHRICRIIYMLIYMSTTLQNFYVSSLRFKVATELYAFTTKPFSMCENSPPTSQTFVDSIHGASKHQTSNWIVYFIVLLFRILGCAHLIIISGLWGPTIWVLIDGSFNYLVLKNHAVDDVTLYVLDNPAQTHKSVIVVINKFIIDAASSFLLCKWNKINKKYCQKTFSIINATVSFYLTLALAISWNIFVMQINDFECIWMITYSSIAWIIILIAIISVYNIVKIFCRERKVQHVTMDA